MLDDDPTRVNGEPVLSFRFASCFQFYWALIVLYSGMPDILQNTTLRRG